MKAVFSVLLLSAVPAVLGHAVIAGINGANGVSTLGFGVSDSIPRNCTSEQPCQLDTPVLKDLLTDPCGATLMGGSIKIQDALAAALKQGGGSLPTLNADGTIEITVHQVNADGGGPFVAMVNNDATGKDWTATTVVQQVPGANGLLRGGPADSQMIVKVDDPSKCTGGTTGDVCLIRLNNGGAGLEDSVANGAGPFGGCLAVSAGNASSGSASGSATARSSAASATASAKTSKAGKTHNNRAVFDPAVYVVRDVHPTMNKRQLKLSNLLARRRSVDEEIQNESRALVSRQELTADLIDELKTALGTAIDIPIDGMAGHTDADPNGGNSTTGFNKANAVLTTQQNVDLKKAVQLAIENAMGALAASSNISVNADGFNVSQKFDLIDTDQANQEAAAALLDGKLTSINLGNAGVGEPNTAVVDSLVGGISNIKTVTVGQLSNAFVPATATATGVAAGGATATVTVTVTASATAAPAATTTAASSRKNNMAGKREFEYSGMRMVRSRRRA
ncbi:hypothetical protein CYLTODRAFT_366625 [Cylindrobasidium torrendii FP15055 ss-10]|uniref:Uncharacterized protein n=1 Tax=Cylindrobasidium torrendii FP15055 ss-10 TaxID=1314674 RepID=A0A0D7BRN6_9AGAR|nr:hypothetical protein CYLTODRAFT_366625 [Cylindrobasidium torrendii FP15055 ss-10]